MIAACPKCGAAIEFRYDDSFVRVCDSCKAAVVRADRGLETLGQFADLVPTASPLALLASGTYRGAGFTLVGRAQLHHPMGGTWDEWYAKFDDGRWGWLSEAQGRFYLLFTIEGAQPAPLAQLKVGATAPVPGVAATMTVAEIAEATYAGAAGELPFKLVPGTTYYYADLSGPAGEFATIDYGFGGGHASIYAGEQVPLLELHILGGVTAPPSLGKQGIRLACPECDGSLELRVPDQTLRIGCPYCGALCDVNQGALQVLARQHKGSESAIPLGAKAAFEDRELTVIGHITRAAQIDGTAYPFEEFLLYHPELGFRWLVQSDGHWNYVRPVDVGAVSADGSTARYDGVSFRRYIQCPLRVQRVRGECYWKVEIGEVANGTDYVAPPAMLSSEDSRTEVNWSLSEYVSVRELGKRVPKAQVSSPTGIAPNQPPILRGIGLVGGLAIGAAIVAGLVMSGKASNTRVASMDCSPGMSTPPPPDPAAPAAAPPIVCFSQPFALVDGQNIAIDLNGNASNSWIAVGGDLVNDETGETQSFDRDVEYYSGYEGGESWSEGSNSERVYLEPMPTGRYVLRLELQGSSPPTVMAEVRQDVFRVGGWFTLVAIVGGLGLLLGLIRFSHERKRWSDSDNPPPGLGSNGGGDDDD
ncbi:MAG: DUF4178 domain-containing protein [Deltaproteobacteria bacterium]|nr:DUF4178 domain-containing protein [Deltaproteobacteria bacterium]